VACICWITIGGCASNGAAVAPSAAPRTYVVRAHDTLYSIAWRHDLDYRELAQWNQIGPDFTLAIGQTIVLQAPTRAPAARVPQSASAPAPPPPSTRAAAPAARVGKPIPLDAAPATAADANLGAAGSPSAAAPAPAAPPGSAVPAGGAVPAGTGEARSGTGPSAAPVPGMATRGDTPVATAGGLKWAWPTLGLAPPRPVPGGGILLLGRLGQDVRAAGSGRVVYTGSGIRGYGNLIIIKHGENWLSSYAHNRELLVHEGQEVAMGQVIAHMGTGPHQVCALYFEIRVNGKPVDPLRVLAPAAPSQHE
jgi:lipoprotein NlpD